MASLEGWDIVFFILYLVVLVMIAGLPLYYAVRNPYKMTREGRELLRDLRKQKEYDKAIRLLAEAREAREASHGSTRMALATIVFVLLGLLLFHVLFLGGPTGNEAVVEVVFAMLASLLSAVVGFYFGGRLAEKNIKGVAGLADAVTGDLPADAVSAIKKVLKGGTPVGKQAKALEKLLQK